MKVVYVEIFIVSSHATDTRRIIRTGTMMNKELIEINVERAYRISKNLHSIHIRELQELVFI